MSGATTPYPHTSLRNGAETTAFVQRLYVCHTAVKTRSDCFCEQWQSFVLCNGSAKFYVRQQLNAVHIQLADCRAWRQLNFRETDHKFCARSFTL